MMKETQEEFAEHCDLSSETVSLIERGKFSPRLETLKKITEYTQLNIATLFNDYLYITEQESDEELITYGIRVYKNNKIIKSVRGVFLNKAEAKEFVAVCNKAQLSPIHLEDFIENSL